MVFSLKSFWPKLHFLTFTQICFYMTARPGHDRMIFLIPLGGVKF